ncbi:allophanate hydrolase [Yinghuangia seranimata]|uniref:allophanate hydrolase n=1 Tax=Yinghuangia seranimata TaxID=408067 RepID=UPI00248AA283|nr:allophanate hydrolase [Yinghuangia seranimata]MDI2132877.1 allophanate hydrolase [Yinghuangia seranimata]
MDQLGTRERGVPTDGPLAGLRFAVKDNLDVAGLPTTGACPALADRVAERDAEAVRRLAAAGAVPVGKTNMDQFATGLVGTRSPYGACHSVASRDHVSGGSSSGSAVAVASGQVPLALGTDTAGSGRVPAAFNGIVGIKPTRGLVSTRGLMPACRSLDCVTTFTRTVAEGRAALAVLAGYDDEDPWSRAAPAVPPAGVAAEARVVGVPAGPLDLDPAHEAAWKRAVDRAHEVADVVVEVDVTAFLAAARLLYEGPWPAERYAAFGALLTPDGPHLDPTVRAIALAGRGVTGEEVFTGLDRLATLRRRGEAVWWDVDALLLPVTPGHPTLAKVTADPVGVNARLGTYTNFVNLLDLAAVAVPAGERDDGLPFGVQFVGPAFADGPLLDLASRWCGEPDVRPAPRPGRTLLAVAGAHLSGLPLNGQLVSLGGRLHRRARTGPGYRLYRLPTAGVPRPGLAATTDGPTSGIAVEVWDLPDQGVGALLGSIPPPLGLGTVALADGTCVTGFMTAEGGLRGAEDITQFGGWRAYLTTNQTTT